MFSKMMIAESTGSFSDSVKRLQDMLAAADAVVIGAGAGLSASAGFSYSGERFRRYFADFEAAYGFHDMYTGGFYPYATPEEYWAYWSRYIFVNRYTDAPEPVYADLLRLVDGKDYFVITTNVDHCFQKAGIDRNRLFCTQGDYGLFQCSEPCRRQTWSNETVIRQMAAGQKDRKIPSALIPVCPYCGRPATVNLRSDDRFVENADWHAGAERYVAFLRAGRGRKVLYLELGVGYNTPGIIKYPFWRMTAENPRATYACINRGEAACPADIADRSVCINGDIGGRIRALL